MSTRSMKASLIFNMTGNISRKARGVVDSFKHMGRTGDQEFGRIGRAADAANRKLNNGLIRGARVGALALGAAVGLSARRMFTLEERLERLGIAAGKTPEEMLAVRDAVNEVANMPNIRIDPGEILAGLETITEATGNFDFGDSVKEQMALAIQATGAGGAEIGKLMAALQQKFDIDTPEEMMVALDTLAQQGKQGAIELLDLASLGPKVFSAFARFGQGGVAGMSEAGGLMQIFKEGVGSAPEAATVFENVLNNMYNPTKMKKLRQAGVQMEDADGNLKGPADLIKAVIESAKGNDLDLSKVFDAEAMRGFSVLSKAYRDGAGFESLDRLANIRGDGSAISADSARMANVTNSQFQSLTNNVNDRIEDNLMEPMTELAKSLNALLDKGIKFTMEDAMNVAAGGVAAVGLAKAAVWTMGGGRGRGGRGGGLGGGMGGGLLDVQPVFVTNMGAGGMGGGLGDGPGGRGKPGGKSRVGRILAKGAGTVATLGGVASTGAVATAATVAAPVVTAGLLVRGRQQTIDFNRQRAAIEASAPWNSASPEDAQKMRDDTIMAQRKHMFDQMSHGAGPIAAATAAPALMTGGESASELAAQLEALLLAEEDTREETQVSGDKVVRAVNGLGDRLEQPIKPMPLSGVLMSQ